MNWASRLAAVMIHVSWCAAVSTSHPRRFEHFKLLFYYMQSFSLSFQIIFQSETPTTMMVEKFLATVQCHISLPTGLPSECLPTDWTHKALFTTLDHKVLHNVPTVSERHLTCCTCLGFSPVWIINSGTADRWFNRLLVWGWGGVQ